MKVLSLVIASTFIDHRKYLRFSSHIFPLTTDVYSHKKSYPSFLNAFTIAKILTSLDKAKITMNNTAEEALLLT